MYEKFSNLAISKYSRYWFNISESFIPKEKPCYNIIVILSLRWVNSFFIAFNNRLLLALLQYIEFDYRFYNKITIYSEVIGYYYKYSVSW